MIHFRLRAMFKYSLSLRCRNSTLIRSTPLESSIFLRGKNFQETGLRYNVARGTRALFRPGSVINEINPCWQERHKYLLIFLASVSCIRFLHRDLLEFESFYK